MSYKITGTGSAMPDRIVTNDDLAKIMDTNDEWIVSRTGIRERRILCGQSMTEIAVIAAKNALDMAKATADEIDLLLVTTLQGDFLSPSACALISAELGIKTGQMLDINMACTGFIFALDAADSYFRAKKAKKALIVSVEGMSRLTNWEDRSTSVLFGDGAGAVVLEPGNELLGINATVRGDATDISVGASNLSSVYGSAGEAYPFLKMNGQEVYIFAVNAITAEIEKVLSDCNLTPGDIGHYILHQANIRIIDSARRKIKQDTEKFPICIDKYGNISSASIPVLLDETNRNGKLVKGEKIVICGFGGGLTSGAAIIEWVI